MQAYNPACLYPSGGPEVGCPRCSFHGYHDGCMLCNGHFVVQSSVTAAINDYMEREHITMNLFPDADSLQIFCGRALVVYKYVNERQEEAIINKYIVLQETVAQSNTTHMVCEYVPASDSDTDAEAN